MWYSWGMDIQSDMEQLLERLLKERQPWIGYSPKYIALRRQLLRGGHYHWRKNDEYVLASDWQVRMALEVEG